MLRYTFFYKQTVTEAVSDPSPDHWSYVTESATKNLKEFITDHISNNLCIIFHIHFGQYAASESANGVYA